MLRRWKLRETPYDAGPRGTRIGHGEAARTSALAEKGDALNPLAKVSATQHDLSAAIRAMAVVELL